MLDSDPISIQFEIPATDHLGKDHVEGKVRFEHDSIILTWRLRGNVFRGGNAKWWKIKDIVLRITDPSLVEAIPGVEMGKMVLLIDSRSREEATKLESHIDYKRSIFRLDESNKRIDDLKNS